MLTIFSTCKPFDGEFKIIQTNAITSWTKLSSDLEIILFGNENGVSEICKNLGLKHISDIKRNELGTPYIDNIFKTAIEQAKYDILCYVNSDIIFLDGLIETVNFVIDNFDCFLIVGRRWNVDIYEFINFSKEGWKNELKHFVTTKGQLPAEGTAIEYFIFNRNLYKHIPDFLIGRGWWDCYLVGLAVLKTLYVFDATNTIFTIHQNHSYKHHKEGHYGVWKGKEAQYNRKIIRRNAFCYKLGNIKQALFRLNQHDGHFTIRPNWLCIPRAVVATITHTLAINYSIL